MVPPGRAAVVVIPFPFSDLSATKLRPAIVLAPAGRDDWLMCQVTSNPYSDPNAIRLTAVEIQQGSLQLVSFARPLKVFTANANLIVKRIAVLRPEPFQAIIGALVASLQAQTPGA